MGEKTVNDWENKISHSAPSFANREQSQKVEKSQTPTYTISLSFLLYITTNGIPLRSIFTENGWTPWTGRTPFLLLCEKKIFFPSDLEIFFLQHSRYPKRGEEMREDRRHLGEGWWSRKHETCLGGTGLCFAQLSRTPSDSPACNSFLAPTIFLTPAIE